MGWSIEPHDLHSVDPELHRDKVLYLQGCDRATLDALELVFVDDGNDEAIVYSTEAERRRAVGLKPNGASISVTQENIAEYLQLFVQYRLIGAIQPQINAFQGGLAVFLNDELRGKLRKCCTVGQMQILMCGVAEIVVDDWEACASVVPGLSACIVEWFWAFVRSMSQEERSVLLHFCTGSARAPAAGFSSLMGYNGQQHRFTLQRMNGGADQLPTASTCFNTLNLPPYTNEGDLRAKLMQAVTAGSGFHEGAVAV